MIIGRKRELELLELAYGSSEAQFITVYGRRRVGKTFLIREFFTQKECHYFHVTGLQHGNIKKQLENFSKSLSHAFHKGSPLKAPSNWGDALEMLTKDLADLKGKVVLFFDELPWLVTRRSGLLEEIDYYWNNQWAGNPNIIFVACGSSASWLLTNIIYNKGGLHNRTTLEMSILPFNLADTRDYLAAKRIRLEQSQIASLYLAIGGIPYYLNYVRSGRSAQENIQKLFFDVGAPLRNEYDKLFESLFDGADAYKEIISILAKKREGMARSELDAAAKLSSAGGYLYKRLKNLCDAGFIKEYVPWGKSIGGYYKVIDEFCLFYLYWVEKQGTFFEDDYWILQSQRPEYYAWAGYAFEALCAKHYQQIIKALGIKGIKGVGSWRFIPRSATEKGAQIDLVIERFDNAITLCEIKYSEQSFLINKDYAAVLQNKIKVFKEHTGTTKQLFLCLITAHGLKQTVYSEEMLSGVVVLDDLFK